MSRMKELAIQLEETPLHFLLQEIIRRFNNGDVHDLSTPEIHQAMTVMEIECLNRYQMQYSEE